MALNMLCGSNSDMSLFAISSLTNVLVLPECKKCENGSRKNCKHNFDLNDRCRKVDLLRKLRDKIYKECDNIMLIGTWAF